MFTLKLKQRWWTTCKRCKSVVIPETVLQQLTLGCLIWMNLPTQHQNTTQAGRANFKVRKIPSHWSLSCHENTAQCLQVYQNTGAINGHPLVFSSVLFLWLSIKVFEWNRTVSVRLKKKWEAFPLPLNLKLNIRGNCCFECVCVCFYVSSAVTFWPARVTPLLWCFGCVCVCAFMCVVQWHFDQRLTSLCV